MHQRDSRNIRSGQINSLVHSEKKKESTSELSNIKMPGRPHKTTGMIGGPPLFYPSIVEKNKTNPFPTPSQEKNTLQEVCVSLLKYTIKRRLHENKIQRVYPKVQTRLDFAKKHLKKPDHL